MFKYVNGVCILPSGARIFETENDVPQYIKDEELRDKKIEARAEARYQRSASKAKFDFERDMAERKS